MITIATNSSNKMIKLIFILLLALSISGCKTTKQANLNLQNFQAIELCNQLILSKHNASEFKFTSIVNELTNRGISASECSKTGLSEFLNKNLPQNQKSAASNNSNSREIEKLKKEIKNLKSKTDDLENDSNSNKNNFQGMEKWREERDKRLRF